jgi:carbonic anhydrase
VSGETQQRGFTSAAPYVEDEADCLVIWCSDHRFRRQNLELLRQLGFERPYVLSLPGGVAVVHSMVAAMGFLSKAATRMIEKAVELTGADEIICIGHEECGAYQAGKVPFVGKISRRLSGKSIEEIQQEHLAKAARKLEVAIGGVGVRTFYASIEGEGERRVVFSEVSHARRPNRRRRSAAEVTT